MWFGIVMLPGCVVSWEAPALLYDLIDWTSQFEQIRQHLLCFNIFCHLCSTSCSFCCHTVPGFFCVIGCMISQSTFSLSHKRQMSLPHLPFTKTCGMNQPQALWLSFSQDAASLHLLLLGVSFGLTFANSKWCTCLYIFCGEAAC